MVVLAPPFNKSEKVDLEALKANTEYLVEDRNTAFSLNPDWKYWRILCSE